MWWEIQEPPHLELWSVLQVVVTGEAGVELDPVARDPGELLAPQLGVAQQCGPLIDVVPSAFQATAWSKDGQLSSNIFLFWFRNIFNERSLVEMWCNLTRCEMLEIIIYKMLQYLKQATMYTM